MTKNKKKKKPQSEKQKKQKKEYPLIVKKIEFSSGKKSILIGISISEFKEIIERFFPKSEFSF
jgi:carbamoylphosphate synthase large subunit